jgi:hypothetical protein
MQFGPDRFANLQNPGIDRQGRNRPGPSSPWREKCRQPGT